MDLFDDSRDNDRPMNNSFAEASDYILDIREYDVPYHVRVMIDLSKCLSRFAFRMQLLTYSRHPSWLLVLDRTKAWVNEDLPQ